MRRNTLQLPVAFAACLWDGALIGLIGARFLGVPAGITLGVVAGLATGMLVALWLTNRGAQMQWRSSSATPTLGRLPRSVALLLRPRTEWSAIAAEAPAPVARIWVRHTIPLTAMAASATALGFWVWGIDGAQLGVFNTVALLGAQFFGGLVLIALMALVIWATAQISAIAYR